MEKMDQFENTKIQLFIPRTKFDGFDATDAMELVKLTKEPQKNAVFKIQCLN